MLIDVLGSVLLLALLSFPTASSQFRSKQWTADSGLPQNSVRGLVQTPDGFIWVATLNGVARFDGIRFEVFDKSNTPGITTSRFVAMVAGGGGDLWLASEDGNIVRYHDQHFITLGDAAGLRPHSAGAITANGSGSIWVLSGDMVLRWNAPSARFDRESFDTADLHFAPLWWVGTGFWAQQRDALLWFEYGRLHHLTLPSEISHWHIRSLAAGTDGALWISSIDGQTARVLDGKFTVKRGSFTTAIGTDTNWFVEVATNSQRWLHFPSDGANQPILYNVLIHDNEDNIWVGSEGQGLFRIQRQFIQTISTEKGLASDNVYPVFHAKNGDMWVGSWPSGLSQIHDGQVVRIFSIADGLPGLITSLAEDASGALWVGGHNGLRKLVNGKLVEQKLPLTGSMPAIQAMLQTPDGAMLLGTPHGLYVWDGARSRWRTTLDGLATDDVRVLMTDRRGDLWVGGYGGLTRIHAGQSTRWTETQGLPSNNVRALMEDSDGNLWVGTYDGGIGWLRNGRWVNFNRQLGLFDNGAFQILEDGQKRFWISSNRGLYRVSRTQLTAVADGHDELVNSVSYGRADGMLSAECNGGLWPAGSRDSNGKLWFPTQKGVAIVDPAAVHTVRQAPRVLIESNSVDHKPQAEVGSVTLRPGQANLEVSYTALSYTNPEQIMFRYKLEGIDHDWQEAGFRRTAYYTLLPPGSYLFRVKARNSDGVASLADATVRITIVPPFYRRWWFLALLAVLVLAIPWTAWSYRIRQLKKAQVRQHAFSRELIASQEGERRRIAAELHDSLGQRLIIINNLALFLVRNKGKARTEDEKQQMVEEISTEASQAIEETRAISYALRPFQLDRLGLTRAIQALAKTVARASEITIRADVDDVDDAFPEDLRINVFRIVQEALNNIVKHSGAERATVVFRRNASTLVLIIADDGHGMTAEPGAVAPGHGGFGLTGMRERVTLLSGTLHIESDGTGTLLTIQFPYSVSGPHDRSDSRSHRR
jgi:signal transduction histidine kinase/ligand-binding sensor domain-containing protein